MQPNSTDQTHPDMARIQTINHCAHGDVFLQNEGNDNFQVMSILLENLMNNSL